MECPKSCCGLLSLQVGVVVIATTFFTLSAFLLNMTVLDYYESKGFPWVLIIVIIFLVLIIGVAVTALIGAYFEHRTMILCSFGITTLSFLYWLIFVILTCVLATKTIPEFCVGTRCAVSLWLVPLHFRDFPERSFHSGEYHEETTTTETTTTESAPGVTKANSDSGGNEDRISKREIFFNFGNVPDDQKHVGDNKTKQVITRFLKENIKKTNVPDDQKHVGDNKTKQVITRFLKENIKKTNVPDDQKHVGDNKTKQVITRFLKENINKTNVPDDQKHVGDNKTKQAITRLLRENINKTKPNFVKGFYFISDDEGAEEIRFQNKIGKTIAVIYLVIITFVFYLACLIILYSYSEQLKEEALEEEEFELFAAPIPAPRKK